MNFFSIVCEFNPFHTGHKYLIEQTKAKTDAEAIVCIMSGSMVQRGDVAIHDKWTRAKAAIENGADLVIELPVCYVLQSADIFAKGAVGIADAIGSHGIAFGSECTDTDLLWKIAKLKNSEDPEYISALKDALSSGMGYPAACECAVRTVLGDVAKEVSLPNSTLGISYLSSILAINSNMKVHIEKRIGNYHDTEINTEFASATAIRQKILSGDKTSEFSLCTTDDIYDINNISAYILGFFRTCDENSLKNIAGMEEGLPERLKKMSRTSCNLNEFISSCVSKRYTEHRIRRVILCSILGITDSPKPSYARVLALNSKGASILKNAKDKIEIITKVSDSSMNEMLKKDILSTDIAALCASKKAGMDYTTSPIVI